MEARPPNIMESQIKNTPKIVFTNGPKLSEHEVQSNFNEKRNSLIPLIRDFISTHERFKDKEVNVAFAHEGVSSLISILEIDGEKIVLKIPLGEDTSKSEAQFLKVWEQGGVRVPHVIEEGVLGEHSYLLMEYIDASTLEKTYGGQEFVEKGIYLEMGRMLRLMHTPEARGYGRLIDGKAEYLEFKDFLLDENIQKKIRYVEENKLLSDEHGSLSLAFEILTEHVHRENRSSYCHDDFSKYNIFATQPLTVFDPFPQFNNRYLDLGRTVMLCIAHDGTFPEQIIDGYFQGEPYDKRVLHAVILLNAYIKFRFWSQVKKEKEIKRIKEYLIQNKDLLEK